MDECIEIKDGFRWYNADCDPLELSGFYGHEKGGVYERLPASLCHSFNAMQKFMIKNSAGGMVRFVTYSSRVRLYAELIGPMEMSHMTRAANSGFDVYIRPAGEKERHWFTVMPTASDPVVLQVINPDIKTENIIPEWNNTVVKSEWTNPFGICEMRINFPLYNGVSIVKFGFEESSQVMLAHKYKYDKPVLFYGSSITQGGCASRPGNCYTHILGRRIDCPIINLGLSGSARGETEIANIISAIPMSVFVMDYDHNADSLQMLRETHEPFFRIIRKACPNLPVVFISKPDFLNSLDDNSARRDVIYKTYTNALTNGDKRVYFIDGKTLFGKRDRDACTVDRVHPNDLGFYRMANIITPVIRSVLIQGDAICVSRAAALNRLIQKQMNLR